MNEQITKLLQQLADKLGTTVSYLWHVLCKQAFINGLSNLAIYAIVGVAGFILYRIHKHLLNDENDISYEEYEGIISPMIVALIAWLVVLVICLFSISDTFSSFLNPEYWALHQILNKI